MKNVALFILTIISMAVISCGQTQTDETDSSAQEELQILNPYTEEGVDSSVIAKMGHLEFVDTLHDFGNLDEGQVVEWDADYTNTGKGDILIQYARSSCGCTVPEHDRKPIKPGQKGSLKITFDSAGKQGAVEKQVTVETNGFPNTYTITIRANVTPAKSNSQNNTI